MRYMRYLCLLIVMTPLVLMAADPVGKITGSGPLMLDGKTVPVTAVSSLPVVAGDEIATSSSAATIFFADKSRATIAPNSRIKLDPNGSSVALRVLSGSVDLKRAEGSQVKLIEPMLPAAPKSAVAPAADHQAAFSDSQGDHDRHCDGRKPPSRSKRCPPCKDKDCRDKDGDKDKDCRDRDCDKDKD